ncbi:MAG TPA: putative ABC transporter permease [Propionibacteriaceae bacterium]|nr:putative ABC transporter permease [Propionibacteriaceae bacterium]
MDTLYSASMLGSTVYQICWSFLIYSFLGVLLEGIFCCAVEGVLEARLGLLYLPLRPMYGVGGVACALVLDRFLDQPISVFLVGMLICTVVEYLASLFMEKAFGTVSWDYRDKPLNLKGRVCLQYSLGWGLLAVLVVYRINPVINGFVNRPGHRPGEIIVTALMTVTLLSAVVTLAAWARTRRRVAALKAVGHGQAPTGSDTTGNRLMNRLVPDPVMINSFPRMSLMTELVELTGGQRPQLTLPRHPRRTPRSGQ